MEDIEPDQLESGGFLVGNQHSLAHISPSLRVNILAGKNYNNCRQAISNYFHACKSIHYFIAINFIDDWLP